MEFMIGCNYWASNAGTEMWRCYEPETVDDDLKRLAQYGVKHLRIFPNWRDFQPVIPLLGGRGTPRGYCLTGEREPENPWYLDETMLERFSDFLDRCDKYGLKVLVGLITGWMSGGLFIPVALYGKNVITDPMAQHFEQLFIRGFVERFRNRDAILAWDLGNECNCMGAVESRWEAANWTAMVANAIRAADPTRPIVSGMHGLTLEDGWTIQDQGLYTDLLTTHPYPFWCEFTSIDETLAPRTTMFPAAQTKLYAQIGKKPCLAEELGCMGPMVCGNEGSADYFRLLLFSLWSNGATGAMWWCANEQTELNTFPYTDQMGEQELGMFDANKQAKPVLQELKRFSGWLDGLDFTLPPARENAVCVLTQGQSQWGAAYMTYLLGRQAGLNPGFAYANEPLPDSALYLMPSVNGILVMPKRRYTQLKQRVQDGADLYISLDNTIFAEFEQLAGLKVCDSYVHYETGTCLLDGEEIPFGRTRNIRFQPTTAQVLAYDHKQQPFLTVNPYGKGRVFCVNAPLETDLLEKHDALSGNTHRIYQKLFGTYLAQIPLKTGNEAVILTWHPDGDGAYAVLLNHHGEDQPVRLQAEGYEIEKVYYGSLETVKAYDACVLRLKKL